MCHTDISAKRNQYAGEVSVNQIERVYLRWMKQETRDSTRALNIFLKRRAIERKMKIAGYIIRVKIGFLFTERTEES